MRVDSIITTILVACALVTTGLVIHREFVNPPGSGASATWKPTLVPHWRDYLGESQQMGPLQAKVWLVEFADFECPFCGNFYKAVKTIRKRHPDELAVKFVHFPIPGHRFALPAARVAECAGEQGKFEAMHDQLFERQDQLGLKSWDEYATAAAVPDMVAFDACIKKTDPIPRVEEGKTLGAKIDVKGTPTIIINGWMLGRPPTEDELDGMVKRILAGKSPVDS